MRAVLLERQHPRARMRKSQQAPQLKRRRAGLYGA
jgi:hypothetical protein